MRQAPGFVPAGKEKLVCRLKKSVYGLKQSARCWNKRIHEVLIQAGFQQGKADPCLYTKAVGEQRIFVLIYVDDILVACEDEKLLVEVQHHLEKHFEITALGDLRSFLGMKIATEKGEYSISLKGYIEQLAEKFDLLNSKPVKMPMDPGYAKDAGISQPLADINDYRSLVGALLYVSVNSRPDVAASMSILGQKVSSPTQADWSAAKRVLKYLYTTRDRKLTFGGNSRRLLGFADADWAGDSATRKSMSVYVFMYGNGAISWRSHKQTCVSLSSMEAEYIALSDACQEAVWLRQLLQDFGEKQEDATIINEDNQGCISFVHAGRTSKRSKHIETRQFYVKDVCDRGDVKIQYCPSEQNTADLFTKPLGTSKLMQHSKSIGLLPA